jgi:hypothetical protein
VGAFDKKGEKSLASIPITGRFRHEAVLNSQNAATNSRLFFSF